MRKLKFLGVPFAFGQDKPGVAKSPDLLRSLGLVERLEKYLPVKDLGNVDFSLCEGSFPVETIKKERQAFLACELIDQCLKSENLQSSFLLSVGGDHGLSLGTIQALLKQKDGMVVVWADAHGDINTPASSPSGNFHGMPLAFLLGITQHVMGRKWIQKNLSPEKLIFFGPRDLDRGEKEIIEDLGIQYFSSEEINQRGARSLLDKALKKADPYGQYPLHLSFDIDLCDANDILSTGTRVRGGPRLSEVWEMGSFLAETGRLSSMDVVELNPDLGSEQEVSETFRLAMDFMEMVLSRLKANYLAFPSQTLNSR